MVASTDAYVPVMLRPTLEDSDDRVMPAEAERSAATDASKADASALTLLAAWLVLFAFWLMLSGYLTPFLVAAGAGCAMASLWLARRMHIMDREGHPIHLIPYLALRYWPWLLKEIVKSGWQVSCAILHPKLPIKPTVVRFRASQTTDLFRVIHANSITLTPGTICVVAEGSEFLVHALFDATDGSLGAGSEMDRRVSALEKHA